MHPTAIVSLAAAKDHHSAPYIADEDDDDVPVPRCSTLQSQSAHDHLLVSVSEGAIAKWTRGSDEECVYS